MNHPRRRRRAVAGGGTGNGDSFLRLTAVRTAASISRYSSPQVSFADAVTAIAGPDGELQRSAGDRWNHTGEGQGGIIGIEVVDDSVSHGSSSLGKGWLKDGRKKGKVVCDFNCGGLFRAYYEDGDGDRGDEVAKVMVFKEEY
jgi:L-asparaginase